MISIIVPVYNVEPYLRKCLDSILAQTYRDLEILVVDDGSTDGSGAICDEYTGQDERIKVFHTENRGLSCARNLGLDEAQGEWIGFVDSDDWIEPGMYQTLLQKAEETGAEIVECGIYREFSNRTLERKRKGLSVSGKEAVDLLLQGIIKDYAWDKLWSRRCFEDIRFPEGRVHEDTAVAYKLLLDAERVSILSIPLYHYRERKGSLSQTYNMANLIGFWLSVKEQYDFLWGRVGEYRRIDLLRFCAIAVSRTWSYFYDCDVSERSANRELIREMHLFCRKNLHLFGYGVWPFRLRVGVFFPHINNPLSFRLAWMINHLTKRRW